MSLVTPTYLLTPHVCRHCQGRILVKTTKYRPLNGRDHWVCASCERTIHAVWSKDLCWCGVTKTENEQHIQYRCATKPQWAELSREGWHLHQTQQRLLVLRQVVEETT